METQAKQEKIVQAIEDHLSIPQNSQNKLASKIGNVSAATLSQMRNGNWESISPEMWNRVGAFFNIQSEAQTWPVIQTKNYKRVTDLCADAKSNKRMLAVSGYTGSGKTTALKQFAKTNPNTYYLLCTNVMGRKEFVRGILKAMGIDADTGVAASIRLIVNALNSAQHPLLILDDAGKLIDSNLRLIQLIYDETEFHAGIVLGGTEYLKKYLDKMAAKDKMGFRELKRRIQYWESMQRPGKVIIAQVANHFGIISQDAIAYLVRMADNYGSLRNLITNALKASENNGSAVTAELLAGLHCGDTNFNYA